MDFISWTYSDNGFGPQRWHERYTAAKGKLQSPINIEAESAMDDSSLGAIQFNYPTNIADTTLTNDGRTLQVTFQDKSSTITGGPLDHTYQLGVLRFHWGPDNSTGSEHQINGKCFPLELQFIHWNKDLYKNVGEAIGGEDGICIVSVLYEVENDESEGLVPISNLLEKDEHKGCFSSEVKAELNLSLLLPEKTADYWTYVGSLTTPPLTENVTWVVFQSSMHLSKCQMEAFRSTKNGPGESIINNCRPICPVNGRTVRSSVVSKSSVMRSEQNDQALQNGGVVNNGEIHYEEDDEEEF